MRIPKKLTRIGTGLALSLILFGLSTLAQEERFFRVTGLVATTITDLAPDGTVTWTNVPINATFTIQVATNLAVNNWVDWVQVPASNATTIHRIFDPNPPVGMAFIPGGIFTMGDHLDDSTNALPLHTAYISAFYMDKYEVTKALWDEVCQWATNHGYSFAFSGDGKAANHPVYTVNWYDVVKWCNARSEREGLSPAYYTDAGQTTVYRVGQTDLENDGVNWNSGYRLPTEAEWEKAGRGGISGLRFPWGNTISHNQANYWSSWSGGVPYEPYDISPTSGYHPSFHTGGEPYTSPVGSFDPSGYGLHDMAGNVSEWCWDWWNSAYYSSPPETDPRGPTSGLYRVVRGGGWDYAASRCRFAYRGSSWAGNWRSNIGLRCVLPQGQ